MKRKLRMTAIYLTIVAVVGGFILINSGNIKQKKVPHKNNIIEIESIKAPTKYIKVGRSVLSVSFLNGTEGKITYQRLIELAYQHKDAEKINILDVGYLEDNFLDENTENISKEDSSSENSIMKSIWITSLPTFTSGVYKTVLYREVLADDRFIDSFAKGQEWKLKNDITVKLRATADGNSFARMGLNLNNELVCRIAKGTILKGPPEDSECNSREIRCTFYQNEGIWERWGLINGIPYYFWGNFAEPSKYKLYAIDRIVRPEIMR
ncbi:hypothetical protein [Acetivibrio clariflavus]|uniref:hypothetical protein n=1 Tax=Acetivibrio clariflavus TaxID=288965 RepID=UPI00119A4687|nr:hypothetical protein [Acetivibrio clariflavus]